MNQYQCFMSGIMSGEIKNIKTHLIKVYNLKCEEDSLEREYFCSMCIYKTRNMDEYKNHMIVDHKKEANNWMVGEIKATFNCDECALEFSEKSFLASHLDNVHGGDCGIIPAKNNEKEAKIIPINKI